MMTERLLHIASRPIGPGEPCYVIAEVGINHNGDLAIAKQLVDAAVAAGADAVKFQKRKLSETYRQEILHQPRHGEQGLQYIVPMLIEFKLQDEQFRQLFEYCRARGITALCTPWDRASVDFLETCDLGAYKIGSPDLTNFPLIEYVARTGRSAGGNQPSVHGTTARVVRPAGRLLWTRQRHRDLAGRRCHGRASARASPDAGPHDARP